MKDKLGLFLMRWRTNKVLPHIEGNLLDIGCGLNELVTKYQGDGVGVDVYQWGTVDFVVKDTANLPFKNEEMDTITIIAALNHIPNRREVLIESRRVLKPDGRIIITMIPPVLSEIWHFLRRPWDNDQHERGMQSGEVYGMTFTDIESLLENTGFKISNSSKFMLGINTMIIAKKKRK